jgi:hypothetical protein
MNDRMETACKAGDDCCPPGCNSTNDDDCAVKCGNGVREGSETCDPLSTCPTSCPNQGCQLREVKNPGTCKAACENSRTQTQCASGDDCCPPACNNNNDRDCQPKCGNGVLEGDETCEPVAECNRRQNACKSDRNNVRQPRGNASQCTFECDENPRQCSAADGQCPDNCVADPDCERCGNGRKEGNEICDGNCPTAASCSNVGCQLRKLTGSADNCDARCVDNGQQTQCRGGDNCCPGGCNANNDSDCPARCGNNVKEPGELCDGNCPASCPDQGCQRRQRTGSNCNIRCEDDGNQADGTTCSGGVCVGGDCRPCGGINQPCCAGRNCNNGGRRCNSDKTKVVEVACEGGGAGTCRQNDVQTCGSCDVCNGSSCGKARGGEGQLCCNGQCDGNLQCIGGSCSKQICRPGSFRCNPNSRTRFLVCSQDGTQETPTGVCPTGGGNASCDTPLNGGPDRCCGRVGMPCCEQNNAPCGGGTTCEGGTCVAIPPV